MPLTEDETDEHCNWALYGWWGSSINVTDGEYTYMLPCRNDRPAYCYSTNQIDAWGWMSAPAAKHDAEAGNVPPVH